MSVGALPIGSRPALFGAASPLIYQAFENLEDLDNLGSTRDTYRQKSRNWALFTHNIFHITPQLDATIGIRYTNERKKFDATFGNNNNICTANQALVDDPSLVNSDPEGEGWFFRIRLADNHDVNELMSADQYREYCEGL